MTPRLFLQSALSLMCVTLAATAVSPAAESDDPPRVLALSVQEVGGWTYFAVTFEQPADAVSSDPNPRLPRPPAELFSVPAWKAVTFSDSSVHALPLNYGYSFIGRCRSADRIALRLSYPLEVGRRTLDVELDLTAPTPAASAPSLETNWAEAGAAWFERFAGTERDPAGIHTYAAHHFRGRTGKPRRPVPEWPNRGWNYEFATGWLAIRESLQLDRLLNPPREHSPRVVPLANVSAVQTPSHPYDKMRGDRQPRVDRLAQAVPQEFWLAQFRRAGGLLELAQLTDDWGGALLRMISPTRTDRRMFDRALEQLALDVDTLRQFEADGCVGELGITGSDPFFYDGTDFTLLFVVRDEARFLELLDQAIARRMEQRTDRVVESCEIAGRSVQRVMDWARRVSAHRVRLGDGLWALGNSPAAIERLLAVQAGERPALADAPDYRFIRATIFDGPKTEEDAFIYLSDAFIRHVVGPELRIKAARRAEAATSLRILSNAWWLHSLLHGPGEYDYETLIASASLDERALFDPEGGMFTIDSRTGAARSEHWGDLRFLAPLLEIPIDRVTRDEARLYEQFREQYERYWREFFDPIAIRIRLGRDVRVETCILPLINNSAYDQLVRENGGAPVTLRRGEIPRDTVIRLTAKVGDGSLREFLQTNLAAERLGGPGLPWLGDWVALWVEDSPELYEAATRFNVARFEQVLWTDPFALRIVAGAEVRNPLALAAALVGARRYFEETVPNLLHFQPLAPYRDHAVMQIRPGPALVSLAQAPPPENPEDLPVALYYSTIGDGVYLATRAAPLRAMIDHRADSAASRPADSRPAGREDVGNYLLHIAPNTDQGVRPIVSYLLEKREAQATRNILPTVQLLGRAGLLVDRSLSEAADARMACEIRLGAEDALVFDPSTQEARSRRHGTVTGMIPTDALSDESTLRRLLDDVRMISASLRLIESGVITTVELERRPPAGRP